MIYEEYDSRPQIAECVVCGRAIYGSDWTHFGDAYYVFEDSETVCEDCVMDYVNNHYRKGD